MKKIVYLLFTIGMSFFTNAQVNKSVLFIGNSYTASHNLPSLVAQMASSVGNTLTFSSRTPGGAQLIQHASDALVISGISSQKWDYVVLQEQSQKPSFAPAYVAANVFPYAKILCDTIRHFDSCTRPIFFMTWGRKNGDAGNCSSSPWLCTYQGMDSALAVSYNTMGQQNDAFVSPVGAVWNYLRANHSTLNLYDSDNSHPNIYGSYAAACTFFTVIFRQDPTSIGFTSTLSNSDAQLIQNAVKAVCFDSLSKWNVGVFDPVANFNYSVFGSTLGFTNTSQQATTYSWDFGDGSSSGVFSPSHTYLSSGNYTIQLIAEECNLRDTFTQTISINSTNLIENQRNNFSVYPNPSFDGKFNVYSSYPDAVQVFELNGKHISTVSISGNNAILDLSFLPKGVYLLKQENTICKLIIQ